ncbi:PEP-CTERM sorting domain-containing protein [Rubellicoccus peritrichatus]|uniref:PEP-CTERM sorting domain-containing protein n=1 Tax=Rubellicoccus peritrichatus TaxID=3080537 RepID=A0AAQ3L8U2_9BACT|nr:PEP-CTERM sorting domain-containing protein [Puniceicoccus sp. CR14]WOO41465.1 PEP-CTERM sorting domain-containing protein [Puniceicoccus sp. CR14]
MLTTIRLPFLLLAAFPLCGITVQAVEIVSNSFEGTAGDSWTYGLDPNATFNSGGDTWAETPSMVSFNFNTAPDGAQFWGGRDMDGNAAFTTTTRGWIVFESIDVSAYADVDLTFFWAGQSNVPEIGYLVSTTTNGTDALIIPDTNLNNVVPGGVTLASSPGGGFSQDWTQVTVNIDNSVTNVAFALYGLSDSGTRYIGYDNVVLAGTIPEPGLTALTFAGLVCAFVIVRRRRRR